MKKTIYIFSLFILFSCNSENAGDCFQTAGVLMTQEFTVGVFTKILVNRDIELIIKEGSPQEVIVETGKNLINDVTIEVVEDQLILTDNNTCNFVRDYGVTKVYITAENISEIRSMTQYDITSIGVLTYPELNLLSEDFTESGSVNSGNFFLEVDSDRLSVVFNNLSNAKISGSTENLSVTLAAGISYFDGANLMAQNVSVRNRSSNDIIVNPRLQLSGEILGTGDVIALNKPPQVDVEEVYKGRLIFK